MPAHLECQGKRRALGTQREYVLFAMLLTRFASIILASAMLTACAHGVITESPTAPGPGPVTIRGLIVTPTTATMVAGNSAPITVSGPFPTDHVVIGAFAQYSDGTGKYVVASWTSSDTSVLTIDGTNVTAMRRGSATVTARAEGMTATATFTVEPTVAGTFSGNLVVDQCDAGSGSMLEVVCGNTPGHRGTLPLGTVVPITLTIDKNGADLTATLVSSDWRGTLRGTDRGENFLTLRGDLTGNRTRVTVINWDSRVQADVMEGFIGFEVRIDNLPSNAAVTAHFDNLIRR